MKYIILLQLILINPPFSVGQGAMPVTIKFTNSKKISERYSVYNSDGKTKHGPYTSYFIPSDDEFMLIKKGVLKLDDFTKQKGNYINGKKDGEWANFSSPRT
ncbi:MAG TPA: hypothetical protein VK590_01980, partial [Saprospiraceae bacterium]|nr:hypothetical protein [Saprospiraceae bacterium]